ncbi:MAG: ribonuclease J, partial [Bacilli bacterium]
DSSLIAPETMKAYRANELFILCTGTQGEPLAAISRIAQGTHKYLKIAPTDTVVFSSSAIPGNAQSINKVVNALYRQGANVLTNSILNNIHASGHANREELKYYLCLVKPKYLMTIHGEYRMQKLHCELAQEVGMPKDHTFALANGDVLLMRDGECRLGQRIDADAIYVDGKDSSGLSTAVIRDRKILANDGVVSVLVAMDSHTNKLLAKPVIISRGFMHLVGNEDFNTVANKLVTSSLEELFKGKVTFSAIKNTIRSSLSTYIYEKTHRNPMIIPVIMNRIDENEKPKQRQLHDRVS